MVCQLFDAFVGSTAKYGAEIWGYTKSKDIERLHLKFLKRLLRVNQSTCNAFVYGELGRYPLYINRFVRIIKYCRSLYFRVMKFSRKLGLALFREMMNSRPESLANL